LASLSEPLEGGEELGVTGQGSVLGTHHLSGEVPPAG
jgi:hypothetical protein